MRFLLFAVLTLSPAFALAQVNVQTGTGGTQVDTGAAGVKVDTGPGGVRVDTGTGTSVKPGGKSGGTSVKTGQGSTTVQGGGQNVQVDTKPGSVKVTVPAAAPAPSPAPAPVVEEAGDDDEDLVIQDDGRTIDHTCGNGQAIIVNGDQNVITLHGPCKDVHVNGARNRITTDQVQSIIANGDANQVQWRAGPKKNKTPSVSTNGNGNTVSRLR
jgi:hypothetical protein